MNFYASRAFLETAAAVWFKGRDAQIADVAVGREVLRLLVVDGEPVSNLLFLDVHQPLLPEEVQGPVRRGGYARNVVRGALAREAITPLVSGRYELAPYVDWSGFASYDQYREFVRARHKGVVRDRERRWRALAAAHGEIVFTRNDGSSDVLPTARAWKSRQLRDTGFEDYFAWPEAMEFLAALRERKLLAASTLRAGGQLVSLWLGFVWEGCWSGWVFGFDPAFRKYSAGHQLLNCMLEESYRLGHREFDFSEGREDYKMIYATHARLLDEIGRMPLKRAAMRLAKTALRNVSPQLFAAVQNGWRSRGTYRSGANPLLQR